MFTVGQRASNYYSNARKEEIYNNRGSSADWKDESEFATPFVEHKNDQNLLETKPFHCPIEEESEN